MPIVPQEGFVPPGPGQEAEEELISLYASHEKIYPRSVTGLFSSWRWALVALTQLIFYGLPW
ncbi:MAG: cytochrome c oxidase accessory protein CcoG, partial [Pseudomonadota bacterium]